MRGALVLLVLAVGSVGIEIAGSRASVADINTLRQMTRCSASRVGRGGTTPEEVYAFRRVVRADNAAQVFAALLQESTIEGQLYSLCGLYFIDPQAFHEALNRYEGMTGEVETQSGCIVSRRSIEEMIRSPYKRVIRVRPGDDPAGWFRAHRRAKKSGVYIDIAGGGFCHEINGTLWSDDAEPPD